MFDWSSSRKTRNKLSSRRIAAFVVVLLAFGVAVAQQPPAAPPSSSRPPSSDSTSKDQVTPPKNPATPGANSAEHLVTPEEAKELFRSVDRILKFASRETELPVRQEVKRELVSRDHMESYVNHRVDEDEDVQRMQRSERVLKKFGLLPRGFDMRGFFVKLLREQVAGYYDPKTKTVNLLNWVQPAVQEPVLAHELTHALQDQSFDLERWLKHGVTAETKPPASGPSPKPDSKDKSSKDNQQDNASEVQSDEEEAARLAVVEGQAMLVLVDYMLAPTGQSVVNSPGVVDAIKKGMMVGDNSPVFNSSPLYLKESLTFAYRYGLDFERELLSKKGKEAAFAGVFRRPPQSEREIMEPAAYMSDEHLPALTVPNFDAILHDSYEKFDVGSFGEFDVSVLVEQFGGSEASDQLTPGWRGGYYYAAQPKGKSNGPLAIVYVSRWASAEGAQEFADVYATSLEKRYRRVNPVRAPQKLIAISYPAKHRSGAQDEDDDDEPTTTEWMTDEGRIIIEPHGDLVLAIESFDQRSADKLREAVLSADKPQR